MPNTSGPLVVALLYDGLCTFEFGIVAEIFGLTRPEMGEGWYRFTSCAIDDASLYRSHERIFTSAGSTAGIDLLIEIVRQDFGNEAANSVARRLVMPAHRLGGQAQFLERPVPARHQSDVAPLLDKLRADLGASWTLARMASECRMSLRTFVRRFTESAGMPPGEWLIVERVEQAKRLLVECRHSIDEIAATVGMGSADSLRHHFRKRTGVSPKAYRDQFGQLGQGQPLTK